MHGVKVTFYQFTKTKVILIMQIIVEVLLSSVVLENFLQVF